jgi:uncharacterized protein YrzB (UPF0473 family)
MTDANQHEPEDHYFYIEDEEGNEEKFEILHEFGIEETGYRYLLLVPAEQEEEEEIDVYPLKYKFTDEEPSFETIEDEKEWQMIEEVLDALDSLEDDDEDDEERR